MSGYPHVFDEYLTARRPGDKRKLMEDLGHLKYKGKLAKFLISYDAALRSHQSDMHVFENELFHLDHAYRQGAITEKEFRYEIDGAMEGLRREVAGKEQQQKEGNIFRRKIKVHKVSPLEEAVHRFRAAAAVLVLIAALQLLSQPSITGAFIGVSGFSSQTLVGVLFLFIALFMLLKR